MQPDPTKCGCGRPKGAKARWCRPCRRRWENHGRPDSGPPPPVPFGEAARRAVQVREDRKRGIESSDPDDGYDTLWETVIEPQRRIDRAIPVAMDLTLCVANSDARGIATILTRFTADQHPALLIVLASKADLMLTRIVASEAPERHVRRAALVAGYLIIAVSAGDREQVGDVLARWVRSQNDYAALAVVLAECYAAAVMEVSDAA